MTNAAPTKVPYFNATRQFENLESELLPALSLAARSGQYILGPQVQVFEKNFAEYCGSRYGIGVGSGTDALMLSLKALGIGKGDEVILPSFTFIATMFAVMHIQAKPVLADVDPVTYTLDPASVQKLITSRTKALLPVHLYGQTANMDALLEITKKKKLKIVEDSCQAHGATWKGKKAGSLGNAGCFSFYPTKNLGAFGDGGMILTNDEKFVDKIHRMRNLGRKTTTELHSVLGWTSRLDTLQASILDVKLKHLDQFNTERRRVAARYRQNLKKTSLILPEEAPGCKHVYHLYVVRVPNGKRDALKTFLAAEGVPTLLHYQAPIHKQPVYLDSYKNKTRLPVTEKISKEILSLPIFPEMKDEEVDSVCDAIQKFYR